MRKNRLYGISYLFSNTPEVTNVSKTESVTYNPLLIYKDENTQIKQIKSPYDFILTYEQMVERTTADYHKNSLYTEMRKRSRESQEKILAEYICSVIIKELRKYKNDDLTFIINDEFHSNKIIGRLGYLGLPLERTHIFFVSRNIASFMTNYIERYAIPPQNDLKLLFKEKYRKRVMGPFPDDEVISMTRTYFCTFENAELYPIRVNLFSQSLSQTTLNNEKEHIKQIFMQGKETQLFDVIGGTGKEKTKIPIVLAECEEKINFEKRKRK